MRTGFTGCAILQIARSRIRASNLQSAFIGRSGSESFHTYEHYSVNCSKSKLSELNDFEHFEGAVNGVHNLQSSSTKSGQRTTGIVTGEMGNVSHDLLGGMVKPVTISKSALSCYGSIQYHDAQRKILEGQKLKDHVKLFVIDIETTGFCRKSGRIIEIAVRDLLGGDNSCFQTLVNPQQIVPNSHIHGITTSMVNHPGVPRMKELIPILMQYIRSRQIPDGVALFVAHNGRCFDVPFLIMEFRRCSADIPSNWLFLDTVPLARELMKLNGSKLSSRVSLQALCEYYGIPFAASNHRAMSDVNLLSLILARMTFDLKLTVPNLLERSFKASDLVISKKSRKKS